MDLRNKKVLIVGFGKSGQAALRYLLSEVARPAVTDLRDAKTLEESMKPFQGYPVDWFLGSHEAKVFASADLIVVSPGVPINIDPLKTAKQRGIPIVSELELALSVYSQLMTHDSRLIAVTGTNGKTTTVSLIHHLLTTAGKKSLLAGNVGRPLLDCLKELRQSEFLVLEISSYQLETTPSLKPDVACLLNITEDHLHWHETFEGYAQAKAKLIRQTSPEGLVVYNGEDQVVTQIVEQIPSRRFMFSSKRELKLGGWVDQGRLTVQTELKANPIHFSLANVALQGIPAWENMLAALLAVSSYIRGRSPLKGNVPYAKEILQKGLETFVPLPHRMQQVRPVLSNVEGAEGEVTYINDSKATNVGATVKALAGLSGSILWIAGGREKGGSYAPLQEWVKKKSARPIFLERPKKPWQHFLKGAQQ